MNPIVTETRASLTVAINRYVELAAYLIEQSKTQPDKTVEGAMRSDAKFFASTAQLLTDALDKLDDRSALLIRFGELVQKSALLHDAIMPQLDQPPATKH